MIEDHAYKTYDKFLKDNQEMLKAGKAPQVLAPLFILVHENPNLRILVDFYIVSDPGCNNKSKTRDLKPKTNPESWTILDRSKTLTPEF